MPFAATWMELEALILSEIREKQMPYDITHIWYLIYSTNELFHRKENHGLGEQTCSCQGGGEGVGWTGNLGLIDADIAFGMDW